MSEILIEVHNVTKKIKNKLLINNVSFIINHGEICGFIGPNGAGKTTMIRLLTGLISPTTGEIFIKGKDIQKDRRAALLNLGAIVDSPIFFPYMSGRKNLRNLARLHPNLSKYEREDRINDVLSLVGLTERADGKVGTYSLGMIQRLGIAQALLGRPEIVILDEPTNGLDPIGMKELRQLLIKLNSEQNITFLVSSHQLDELQQYCNRFIFIRDGRMIWQGLTTQLTSQYNRLEDAFMELMKS